MDYIQEIKKFLQNKKGIIIAIDGPAGSGKSTLARSLAKVLSLDHISMGNLFRVIAAELAQTSISDFDSTVVIEIINQSKFSYRNNSFFMNEKLYDDNKNENIDRLVSVLASNSEIHSAVTKVFRNIVHDKNVVVDGRATGSYIFPNATLKLYIDADINVRAKRRYVESGDDLNFSTLKEQMLERDLRDTGRKYAPLVCTDEYIRIDSTNRGVIDIFNKAVRYIYYSCVLSNTSDSDFISNQIVEVLSDDSCLKVDCFEKVDMLYYLLSNVRFDETRFLDEYANRIKSISIELINQLFIQIKLNLHKHETFFKILNIVPRLCEIADDIGFGNYKYLCSNTVISNEVHDMLNIIQNCITQRNGYGIYWFNTNLSNEMMLLIKPDASMDIEIIRNIFKRIYYYGCSIAAIQVRDGIYYQNNKEKVARLYKEAYDGYTKINFSEEFYKKVKVIYETDLFQFLFEEKFDLDMLVSANSLIKDESISPDIISEIWDKNRHYISLEKFKSDYKIDNIKKVQNGLCLTKGQDSIVLHNVQLNNDGEISLFYTGRCYGINKPIRSYSTLAVKDSRIRNGKVTIIVNGHVQSLLDIFTNPDHNLIVSLIINKNNIFPSWNIMRLCFSGDDSDPSKCLIGSVRRNSYENQLLNRCMNMEVTGLKNVVHLSNGPLEALSEISNFFELPIEQMSFGKMLLNRGVTRNQIQEILNNPITEAGIGIFEATAKKSAPDALKIIENNL